MYGFQNKREWMGLTLTSDIKKFHPFLEYKTPYFLLTVHLKNQDTFQLTTGFYDSCFSTCFTGQLKNEWVSIPILRNEVQAFFQLIHHETARHDVLTKDEAFFMQLLCGLDSYQHDEFLYFEALRFTFFIRQQEKKYHTRDNVLLFQKDTIIYTGHHPELLQDETPILTLIHLLHPHLPHAMLQELLMAS